MQDCYSYKNEQALLLIKALEHYRDRIKVKPMDSSNPPYILAVARGLFDEPASQQAVSRLLSHAKKEFPDFGTITLFFQKNSDRLAKTDLQKLATYSVAIYCMLIDGCLGSKREDVNYETLRVLKDDLIGQLDDQVQRHKDQGAESNLILTREDYEIDPDTPTTYAYRFQMALALLCGNHLPDARLCELWFTESSEEAHSQLQEWAINHTVMPWATGIGTIEAALALADTPVEHANHERSKSIVED